MVATNQPTNLPLYREARLPVVNIGKRATVLLALCAGILVTITVPTTATADRISSSLVCCVLPPAGANQVSLTLPAPAATSRGSDAIVASDTITSMTWQPRVSVPRPSTTVTVRSRGSPFESVAIAIVPRRASSLAGSTNARASSTSHERSLREDSSVSPSARPLHPLVLAQLGAADLAADGLGAGLPGRGRERPCHEQPSVWP